MSAARSSRGARVVAARVALVAASLLLAAGAAELGLRAIGRESDPFVPRVLEPPEPDLPVYEGRSIYAPNLRGIRSGAFFRTNERGLRGPSYPARPEAGVFRIAIAGDSITMGGGVLEEEAYPALLADLLEPPTGQRVEVLNFGLGGLHAGEVTQRLARHSVHYGPHMVVYGYTLNDIQGKSYVELFSVPEKMAATRKRRRWRDSASRLVAFAAPRLASVRTWLDPDSNPMTAEYYYNYRENPAAWGGVEAALDRLVRVARGQGVCPHLFIHTQIAELSILHPMTTLYEQLEEAGRARGIWVSQSFPGFRGKNARSLWVGRSDPHPNPAGHRILARALADGLREMPELCWAPARERVPWLRHHFAQLDQNAQSRE